MQDKLDPLIAERAPWLFANDARSVLARKFLDNLLGYRRTVALGTALQERPPTEIMNNLSALVARQVRATGLERIPKSGPALVVSNHPTGIADGIILWSLLAPLRPDLFIYANSDILRVLPQMSDIILPVEWRLDRRTHAKTRETMAQTRAAIEAGRLGVIFPSGRLAKRRGLSLHERDWMPSAAMIARKFGLPVIPINIRARNSTLFYLFDLIHPTLRDITLFHETLNKGAQPFRVNVGAPILPGRLPDNSGEAIEMLKSATLALAGRHAPSVSIVEMTARPSWLTPRRQTAGLF